MKLSRCRSFISTRPKIPATPAEESNEFLINFGRLDKITRIKIEEAAQ